MEPHIDSDDDQTLLGRTVVAVAASASYMVVDPSPRPQQNKTPMLCRKRSRKNAPRGLMLAFFGMVFFSMAVHFGQYRTLLVQSTEGQPAPEQHGAPPPIALEKSKANALHSSLEQPKPQTKFKLHQPDEDKARHYKHNAPPDSTTPTDVEALRRLEHEAFLNSTEPDPNLRSISLERRNFFSGFRNAAMAFTIYAMRAHDENYSQILLPTLNWKDLHASGKPVPHEKLFDVVHWNSFYPQLPKLVRHHPSFRKHGQTQEQKNSSNPYVWGKQSHLFLNYMRYTESIRKGKRKRHPVEMLMMRGAFRPHPEMQRVIQTVRQEGPLASDTNSILLGLHARIEPDMQKHTSCVDKKVRRLADILDMVYREFPLAPASKVFLPINRAILEKEGLNVTASNNTLAGENLQLLNQIRRDGMWNGTVPVFEGGAAQLNNGTTAFYAKRSGISGAVLDYFISLDSDVFVGAEVSSFSVDVITTRFFRGNYQNYLFVPGGLKRATPETAAQPPRFSC
jgi:hypothetical protein